MEEQLLAIIREVGSLGLLAIVVLWLTRSLSAKLDALASTFAQKADALTQAIKELSESVRASEDRPTTSRRR